MEPEQITPEMVKAVQAVLKTAMFDGGKYEVDIFNSNSKIAPCSLTQMLFPEIIDIALEHLARKASISLVQWMPEPEKKTCNVEYIKKEWKIKNELLPKFDWNLVAQ